MFDLVRKTDVVELVGVQLTGGADNTDQIIFLGDGVLHEFMEQCKVFDLSR